MGFLQLLLLILKILGILFAVVIAFFLISVVLLLFVPLRYRLQGHKAEDYGVEAGISWLLHMVRVKIKYTADTKLFYEVRLLWFLLLSSDETWKAANEERKKRKAEKQALKNEKKKQKQKEKQAKEKAKRKKKQRQTANIEKKQQMTVPAPVESESLDTQITGTEAFLQDTAQEKKKWFFRISEKIQSVFRAIKDKLAAIRNTVKSLWQKADKIIAFLCNETNKVAFGASWTTLIQLLKHVGPTKIRGYLAFGMDDPATTGYILAVLGIFYGKFGKSFSIRPNFEEKQLETEIRAKGRIRMSHLLRLVWKLWRNKDFKTLLENIKQLKG